MTSKFFLLKIIFKNNTHLKENCEYGQEQFYGFSFLKCGSAGKESACNAGDLGSISGLQRSPGERKGNPLLYSCKYWLTKNQTRLSNFHFHFPLEKGMATHSNILAWRIPGTEEPGGLQFMELERAGQECFYL